MEIRATSCVQASQPLRGVGNVKTIDSSSQISQPDVVDQLDISPEAQAAGALGDATSLRADRIAEIKSQIADGTYLTRDKIEATVDRIVDHLA